MLKKNLQRYTDMSGKVAEAFEVMPTTFVLPHEYTSFVQAFTEADSKKQGNGKECIYTCCTSTPVLMLMTTFTRRRTQLLDHEACRTVTR